METTAKLLVKSHPVEDKPPNLCRHGLISCLLQALVTVIVNGEDIVVQDLRMKMPGSPEMFTVVHFK